VHAKLRFSAAGVSASTLVVSPHYYPSVELRIFTVLAVR